MGRRGRWAWLSAAAVVLALAAFAGHRFSAHDVRAVEPAARSQTLVVRGRLEPGGGLYEVAAFTIAPTAYVGQVLVRENDVVSRGDLLATLGSHAQAKAQVDVAAAAVEVAERNLAVVRRPYKNEVIAALDATIKARAADLDLAQRRVRRSSELIRRDAATADDHDTRIATVDRAAALLREAEARLKAETEISETELQRAIAQVAESRARLRDAQAQYDLTEVRAPAAGTILKIHAKAGEMVSGRAIIEMGDVRNPRAVAEVDERFIAEVRRGQKAQVSLTGGGPSWGATVTHIRGVVLDVGRAPTNAVTARGGRIVEVELAFDRSEGLPQISGLELVVRIERAVTAP